MQGQVQIFRDWIDVPKTEGINYAGSKLKLLPHIFNLSKQTGAKSIFDGFSGSTRVSQSFAQAGYRVVSNDISEWSRIFATCYLKNLKNPKIYQPLIDHLNSLPPEDGWFTENYGGDVRSGTCHNAIQKDGTKKPWQKKNTRKLDAIRREIDALMLDDVSKSVALTSLILGLNEIDSTLGHFVSYLKGDLCTKAISPVCCVKNVLNRSFISINSLIPCVFALPESEIIFRAKVSKDWSPRSFKNLQLKVPRLWKNEIENTVLCGDVFKVLPEADADLAYFDPPYGSNNEKMPPSRVRYASYYHLWTTICKNDHPVLFGKSLRRKDTSDKVAASVFEEFRRSKSGRLVVVEAIERLLKETPCRWILLSYSSGGRATAEELNEVITRNGEIVDSAKIEYKKNVMAAMKWTNEWLRESSEPNKEFLFLIRK